MGSLDSRVGHLEQRRNELQAEIDGFADAMAALEARVAALEACVDCDQVPPCPRPKQAAQSRESDKTPAGVEPAPQQPRSCDTCRWNMTGDCPRVCFDPARQHEYAGWQPRGGGGAL